MYLLFSSGSQLTKINKKNEYQNGLRVLISLAQMVKQCAQFFRQAHFRIETGFRRAFFGQKYGL